MPNENTHKWIAGAIAVVVVGIFFGGYFWSTNNDPKEITNTNEITAVQNTTTPSSNAEGLIIEDTKIGTGAEAVKGKKITVQYTGKLTNGQVFDSSIPRGQAFEFTLGIGQVIRGWDEGFAGMKVGGKRTLTIPPELGYGDQGAGDAIPPGATLIFDVELVGVEN
ncbi:MAG: FKBP-type peptidyl-prolyl cis-trans isomerase [Candidatus Paceibacterota bacterium]|jgi:FKBP-type peptidyl-prolyl cis-trans isomerase